MIIIILCIYIYRLLIGLHVDLVVKSRLVWIVLVDRSRCRSTSKEDWLLCKIRLESKQKEGSLADCKADTNDRKMTLQALNCK